jgi:hypothetical protein
MTVKVAYFQPTVLAIDDVPPATFSQIYGLAETLHAHPELNDSENPFISIRGGQQIQVYPNQLNLDVRWLVEWLESIAYGYMELITQQSGAEDLKLCKPVVNSIWTIKQKEGDYQELHSHPGGHLSGNIYITVPEFKKESLPSDGQVAFRMPQTRDVSKFIMTDTWRYTPEAGTVVLFPSQIPHTVYPWKGDGERTVMAFDIVLLPKEQQDGTT